MDQFDPETVPTVGQLLNELNSVPSEDTGARREGKREVLDEARLTLLDYEYTSLKPYVDMFEKHVNAVVRDSRGLKKGELEVEFRANVSHQRGEYGLLSFRSLGTSSVDMASWCHLLYAYSRQQQIPC